MAVQHLPASRGIESTAPNEAIDLFEMDADSRFARDRRLSLDSSLGIECTQEEETLRAPAASPTS